MSTKQKPLVCCPRNKCLFLAKTDQKMAYLCREKRSTTSHSESTIVPLNELHFPVSNSAERARLRSQSPSLLCVQSIIGRFTVSFLLVWFELSEEVCGAQGDFSSICFVSLTVKAALMDAAYLMLVWPGTTCWQGQNKHPVKIKMLKWRLLKKHGTWRQGKDNGLKIKQRS